MHIISLFFKPLALMLTQTFNIARPQAYWDPKYDPGGCCPAVILGSVWFLPTSFCCILSWACQESCLFFPVPAVPPVHCNGNKHTAIPVANTSEKFLQKYFVCWCCESLDIFLSFFTLCSCFVILVPSCKVSREFSCSYSMVHPSLPGSSGSSFWVKAPSKYHTSWVIVLIFS